MLSSLRVGEEFDGTVEVADGVLETCGDLGVAGRVKLGDGAVLWRQVRDSGVIGAEFDCALRRSLCRGPDGVGFRSISVRQPSAEVVTPAKMRRLSAQGLRWQVAAPGIAQVCRFCQGR